jgi:hypothetical protein
MSAYPRNLSYFVKRLANYSKNTYRLQTLNTTTTTPSQIITVDLPNNALVDLSTLVWYFEGTTTTATNFAAFPRNIETIIERVEVEVNGQLISPGCNNYGHLFNIIADTTMGEDATNRRALLQNGLNVTATANDVARPFTICNWLGFLGSAQPTVLDTNLLGNVRIRITLANTNVLMSSATAATGVNYSLANMFFSVDCISIDDGMYYAIHDQALSKGMTYEIPFNNFYSFSQPVTAAGDGSVKFSLSTQSLNHLWGTFVYGGNAPQTPDVPSATGGSTHGIGSSYFFLRSACGISGYQWNINNQYVPNFRPSSAMAFQLLMNSYGLSQDTLGGINRNINTLSNWQQRYWVSACALDHQVGSDERYISGLDTRGNVAQGFFEYQGATVTNNFIASGNGSTSTVFSSSAIALIFAQTTSVLRIGAGRQLALDL